MIKAATVRNDTAAAIQHALDGGYRVIATLDGALVDDIEDTLEDLGIWGRPLLGDTLPRAQRAAGPWMIAPDRAPLDAFAAFAHTDDTEQTRTALAKAADEAVADNAESSPLFQDAPPSVANEGKTGRAWSRLLERHGDIAPMIWAFPSDIDEAAIRRHLRNLNVVRLARRPRPRHPAPVGAEEVAFRHADGRIIASLLPLLRPAQIARLMGPAAAFIAMTPDDVIAVQSDGTPAENPDSPLSLDAAQVDQLEEPRYAQLDGAIMTIILRDHAAPDDRATRDRITTLRRYVLAQTGFRADQHICDLVEVMWHDGTDTLHRPDVTALLSCPGWSQERCCATLRRKFVPLLPMPETA